ncbi:MAG: zf-HC2 domain-containing protein [Lachnospiraceae bacterium]|nr:zf-HC2 domain-containing protein [Lachnospiraceae bacterium]
MDCKQIQRLIPAFLRDELKGRELMRFLRHMDTCEECKEELTIQYLSSEGISRLEEGKTFDLDRELTEYMVRAANGIKRRRNYILGFLTFEAAAILILFIVFIYALA